MDTCDLTDFDERLIKEETTDIWEELDTIVATFETSNFLDKGKCKDRVDIRKLPLPRLVSPDCSKILGSAWNSQPHKPPYNQSQQDERTQHESSTFTRPFCRQSHTDGRAIPEAWPVRVVPRKPYHDYSQQLSFSQQALGIGGGSQGRIGTVDPCCDNFDGIDGVSTRKAGKMGAPWRHVKSAVGAAGQQFAFVDGSVRIRDGCALDRMSGGGEDGRLWLAPSSYSSFSSRCKTLRPTFAQAPKTLTNGYAERARKGHVYWYVEDRRQLCDGALLSRRGKCR